MGYHPGPYRDPDSLPGATATRPKLHTARKISTVPALTYDFDADGNPEPMDAVAQRVLLLVARAEQSIDGDSGRITDQSISAQKTAIRQALSILVDGPEPVIADLTISVEEDVAGTVKRTINYRALPGNKTRTVQLP